MNGILTPAHVFDAVAIVCFAVAAIPFPVPPAYPLERVIALGLVFFTLAHLVIGG